MQKSEKRIVLIATSVSSFLTPFMGSSVNIALPEIGREFALSAVTLGWIATAYILSSAVFLVPFGKLADIHGRKKIFTLGIAVHTLFSYLAPLAPSPALLIASRALQGLGGAMIFGTGVAILSLAFPAGERGKALGINAACIYLGLSLGPFLGGLLTQHFGWRSIFYVNGMISALLLLFTLWKMKEDPSDSTGERLDPIGTALYGTAVALLMIGFSRLPALHGFGFVTAGIGGFIAFVYREKKSGNPMLNIKLFRHNTVYAFSNMAALINYCSTAASAFLLSLYLQFVKGQNPRQAGLILVFQPIVMTFFSPLAGRLSDRIDSRTIASLGMLINTIALVFLVFLRETTPQGVVVLALMLLGFGLALFSSPNTNAIMGSVEKRFYGIASAMLGTMRLTGQMLSMGITMMIFSIFVGGVRITPAVYKPFMASLRIAFFVFAVLSFAGIFASLARGKSKKEENE